MTYSPAEAQQDGNISSDQTPQQDGNATSDQASQDISGTIVQNEDSDNVTIKASDKPYLALGADLNDSQRATFLLWALMRQICQIMMWSM